MSTKRDAYHKQYREQHKEELNKQSRQYREQHIDELKEYNSKYYEENKAILKEKHSIPVHCHACNKDISKWNYASHKKTKVHLANLDK